ncbi:hypothetical protein DFH08DRAFT_799268 [Mycena albidolilacea]|uniref:NACHT domain-containing protein n=1 Tax=Mycena albidolilacea TaxID=1033008 RepID=A0AAD7AL90_9AGAR|nr:hypothetical protein DFH08DRAFT_799268 [Mycena albidolilacea]
MAAIGEDIAQAQDGHRVPAEKARGERGCGGSSEAIAEEPDARKWDVPCAWRGLGSQDRDGPARGVDENAAVDVGGMYLRAPKADARGLAEGAAGQALLNGREGLLEPRHVGGDATCVEIDMWMEIPSWRDGWRRWGWRDGCEAAMSTDGVVDERVGYCATRRLTIWQRNVEGMGRWAETNRRVSNGDGASLGLTFFHKTRALVERKGVGVTYLPKRARCRAFRGGLSSNEPIVDKLSGNYRKRRTCRCMHLVPIPGFTGVSETEALMALRTRSRSQSVGEDDSPEDILMEKYRSADGVREVDPSEIMSATRVNRLAAGAQAAQFSEEQYRCFAVIGACIRDRSAREERVGLQRLSAAARGMVDEAGTGHVGKRGQRRTGRSRSHVSRGGVGTRRKNQEDISEDRIPTHQSSSALNTIEAGNEWPVHIAVVVLLAVEESRGERSGPRNRDGNTCAELFDRDLINVALLTCEMLSLQKHRCRPKFGTLLQQFLREPDNKMEVSLSMFPQILDGNNEASHFPGSAASAFCLKAHCGACVLRRPILLYLSLLKYILVLQPQVYCSNIFSLIPTYSEWTWLSHPVNSTLPSMYIDIHGHFTQEAKEVMVERVLGEDRVAMEVLGKVPLYFRGSAEGNWLTKLEFTAGAGKTVLVSMVVDHLSAAFRNNKDIGVACIYLNHKEADQQSPLKILAENLYKQHWEKGTVPSLQEVADILSSSLKEFSQVFIVIDAIDEYPEDQRFILLKHLAEQMGLCLSVNLMVTSRPHVPAGPTLPNVETLEIGAMPEDIQNFVNRQIDLSPHLYKHVQRQPKLREDIHSKISSKSVDGMFLLAKLHIDSLSTKNTIREVREALNALPESLYGSYDIAIQRIDAQSDADRRTAHSAITWVTNAKRPLTVEELQVALAVKPGMRKLDEEEDLTDIDIILSVCAGLVIVDRESSVVRLVHYTTQEYLDSIQALLFPDAQTEITHTLLTFLNFDGYPELSWADSWHDLPPLVEYSQYCLAHAAGQSEVQLRKVLLEFLGGVFRWKKTLAGGKYSLEWQWNTMPWNYPGWPSRPSALWISAAANLVDTAKFLLDQAPLQLHSEHPEIIVASYYGHAEIVSFLLEKGADVNAAGGENGSSLQAAAAEGHTEIVSILLEKGANINAAGGFYGSSLQAAAAGGHTEIFSILLEKGADINAAGGRYGSSLQAAAAGGHTEIVGIFLEKGANVNAAGGFYGSSLQAAAAGGHTEIFRILFEKGADINAAGGRYGSSLQAAAAGGHTEIVGILLEKGAEVNAAGGFHGSSLQAAAAGGHTEIVGIFLEKGAVII